MWGIFEWFVWLLLFRFFRESYLNLVYEFLNFNESLCEGIEVVFFMGGIDFCIVCLFVYRDSLVIFLYGSIRDKCEAKVFEEYLRAYLILLYS